MTETASGVAPPGLKPKQEAFLRLVREVEGKMLSLAYHLCGSRQDAEDIAQEALLRAYRGLGELRQLGALKGWLFRIVVHCAREHYRRRAVADRTKAQAAASSESRAPEDPARAGERREELDRVFAALDRLGAPEREALVLVSVQGMSPSEAAEALGLNPSTLRGHLHQGREQLRRMLSARE